MKKMQALSKKKADSSFVELFGLFDFRTFEIIKRYVSVSACEKSSSGLKVTHLKGAGSNKKRIYVLRSLIAGLMIFRCSFVSIVS